jgi:hypothetical protein
LYYYIQAIAWEWGGFDHPVGSDESPDDEAQRSIAQSLQLYAGSYTGLYPIGRLNDLVYPVNGGMEDWGYASSWENNFIPETIKPCQPTNSRYNPYPSERTIYSSDMLRAFNFLVETSDDKEPPENTLGTNDQILKANGVGDGHIPRNIRLTLMATDIVQPYLKWTSPIEFLSRDFIESSFPTDPSYILTYASVSDIVSLELYWEVGGSLSVDTTQLLWGEFPSYDQVKDNISKGCVDSASTGCTGLESSWFNNVKVSGMTPPIKNGKTRWSGLNITSDMNTHPFFDINAACISFLASTKPTNSNLPYIDYFVVAKSSVDHSWTGSYRPVPDAPPQSHIVNARQYPSWEAHNGDKTIKGRDVWYSWPLRIRVMQTASPSASPSTIPSSTSNQASVSPPGNAKNIIPTSAGITCNPVLIETPPFSTYLVVAFLCAAIPAVLALLIFLFRTRRHAPIGQGYEVV